MSRGDRHDAVIAGGGVVGAAAALALAGMGLRVALVEAQPPAAAAAGDVPDLRVYALAPDNAALLARLGAWEGVRAQRLQPYRRMQVWDAGGGAPLVFDADALGQPQLGWIVENAVLVRALWQRLPAAGVEVLAPARIAELAQDAEGVRLCLDDGRRLRARLALAADGGESALRRLAGIAAPAHDYHQSGVVAFVASERPHAQTCWQRFQVGGPVALLPFADQPALAPPGHLGSIVWSLPRAEAERLLVEPEAAFAAALARAFGGELGAFRLCSPRAAFPLRRQLAERYAEGRVLLLGDAAHRVHPLAGQGVNLGLRDVAALAEVLGRARAQGRAIDSPARLARWARARRSATAVDAYAFEAINAGFASDALLPTLVRGPLLGLAGRLPPLVHALWRHAAGA